ncbi:hypothetical protein PHMEG_00021566 [Phytophthora megakarya]|uniref:Uncharacterized protein n=1 Tax=Phytophthora megakarya TaxID=4795 RepID=A0A225VNU9_9STRA|nr:hypothetical protein PHMEG_00021566 [Phytophthora megakarya]
MPGFEPGISPRRKEDAVGRHLENQSGLRVECKGCCQGNTVLWTKWSAITESGMQHFERQPRKREPEAESADSDAHEASSAKNSEDGSAGASEADSRKSDLEDDSQVEPSESSDRSEDSGSDQPEVEESGEESVVEVMVKMEPSAEDRDTDSPQRPSEAEIVKEKIDVKVERPLSTVQEEAASEDMEVSPALTETSAPEVPLARPTSKSRTPRSPVTVDAHDADMPPAQAEDVSQAGVQVTEDQAKFYVASQCQRWKEAPAGLTVPPGIRYEWPFGKTDSQAYYLATL